MHTTQMVAFEVINARETPLTDITTKVLVCRLHGGPSGRSIRGNDRESGGKGEVLVLWVFWWKYL